MEKEKNIQNFLEFCKKLVQNHIIGKNFLEQDGSTIKNKEMNACKTFLFYNIVKYNMQSQYISSETNFSFLGDLSHDEISVLENIVFDMKEDLEEKTLYPKIKSFLDKPKDIYGNPSMLAPTEANKHTIKNTINAANTRGKHDPLGENTILTAEYFLNSFLNLLSKAKFYCVGSSDKDAVKNRVASIKKSLNDSTTRELAMTQNFDNLSQDAKLYSACFMEIIPSPTLNGERERIKRNNIESECYVAAFRHLIHCKKYFEQFNALQRKTVSNERKKENVDYQEKTNAAYVINGYRTKVEEEIASRIRKGRRDIDRDLKELYEELTEGEKDAKNLLKDFVKDTGIESK